jgi:hypothetical protein
MGSLREKTVMRRISIAALSCMFLASCGGGAVVGGVGGEYVSPFYSPSLVSYVAQDGRFPMVLRGNPFAGIPQAQLEQTLHQEIPTPGWAPRAQFVRNDNAEAGRGLRLVVLLNPVQNVDFRAICGDLLGIGFAGPTNQITLRVAFCDNAQTMTDVTLRTAPSPDPTNPAFTGALSTMTSIALPFVDRARER